MKNSLKTFLIIFLTMFSVVVISQQPLRRGAGADVPSGFVLAFAGANCPTGFLKADGSTVSRTTHAQLFSAISTFHGNGNGTTTFHLPDYRGRFLRGVDESAGLDPDKTTRTAMNAGGNVGNLVGSVQSDTNQSHTHTYVTARGTNGQAADYTGFHHPTYFSPSPNTSGGPANVGSITIVAHNGLAVSGGNESKPKNAYVTFCVKF